MRKSYFQMLRSGIIALTLSALLVIGISACSNGSSGSDNPETITFTVTFNTNGGSNITSQTVEKGKKATKPSNPTKTASSTTNYTFAGWYSDNALSAIFDFETPINGDITLYAKWNESSRGLSEDQVSRTFSGTSYTELSQGTNGSAGTSGAYALFGDWPQSAKKSDVIIYDSITVTRGAFTYYKGNDDAWYVKHDDEYFKVEPIKWRILSLWQTSNTILEVLLAENVLEGLNYYSGEYNQDRTIENQIISPNNYEYSTIRAYLNGLEYWTKEQFSSETTKKEDYLNNGFFQTAFTNDLQNKIANTALGGSISDKIFLMSHAQITRSNYGFVEENQGGIGSSRIRIATDYAKATLASQADEAGMGAPWYLRTPSDDTSSDSKNFVKYVADDGKADGNIEFLAIGWGMVPALNFIYN